MIDPLDDQMIETLINEALLVGKRAYAPYSRFQVGAALLTSSGQIHRGCNVENASFSLTICAERTAAAAAIASGDRHFIAMVVASRGGATPCGGCRQFLAEFAKDLSVLTVDAETGAVKRFELSALLPHAFEKAVLPAVP